jgi:hypothetical protein
VGSKSLLLDSDVIASGVHLGTIGMLHEKATIGVADADNVVFADHHDS